MAGKKRKVSRDPWLKRKKPRATPSSAPLDSSCRSQKVHSRKSISDYKLCGFLVAVASRRNCLANGGSVSRDSTTGSTDSGSSGGDFVGSRCSLSYQGTDSVLAVGESTVYYALDSGLEIQEDGEPATPASKSESGYTEAVEAKTPVSATFSSDMDFSSLYDTSISSCKRRRVPSSLPTSSVIVLLQKLCTRNNLHVEGQVVKVVQDRVVVLLDVYLPSATLSSCWKGSPAAASALNHLSCDWRRRQAILGATQAVSDQDVLNVPDCHVVGCSVHCKSAQKPCFDLQEIFKGLSARDPRADCYSSDMSPAEEVHSTGFWELPEEILLSIFSKLQPRDLFSVAAVCQRTRFLARSVIPCMNLRLFPHQRGAVLWMLHREANASAYPNPLYRCLKTEDELHLYLNSVTGDVSIEMPPQVQDFRGGLFCDEPGLGKTITALSLILKTQGQFAQPPDGVEVVWSEKQSSERLGYYEFSGAASSQGMKRNTTVKTRSRQSAVLGLDVRASTRRKLDVAYDKPAESVCVQNLAADAEEPDEATGLVWVQCDGCSKWRKLLEGCKGPKEGAVWFCRMNTDPDYQSCSAPQEAWDSREQICSFEGFYKGKTEASERNVAFFKLVLKQRVNFLVSETKLALEWLSNLAPAQLETMAAQGLAVPQHLRMTSVSGIAEHSYEQFFQAFGLVSKQHKKVVRWHYPAKLRGFHFDTAALKLALATPVEETSRVYLSKTTLVVVPANLVDHWKAQIERHTRNKQLRFCVCLDSKRIPSPHALAWDYDVVITTFSRLSAEWTTKENSPLMQVHWFRVVLDEGHTLGASLALTNKLQMAISMHASRRWVLTGTPTPDTPNSQLVHLQPMLRYLHEQLYGSHYKTWDAAILRPFEAQCEEGRLRLLELLQRCMICARKADLSTIPPCLRRVKLIDFDPEHAGSYNQLVETVRRNILMADWNDPDHVESLLNPRQWKLKSSTLKNVRLSCCVAGQIKLQNSNQDIQETMDMLLQDGLDPVSEEYTFIRDTLLFGGNCFRCGQWCRLPMLTPCRHFLCLNCVSLDGEKCSLPNCGRAFKMQMPKARPENPNPKWPVPQDLIELQPSYIQEEWHPEWQATSSSKVAYLMQELGLLQETNQGLDVEDRSLEKVIVFSQFLEHISVIELQLKKAGIQHAGMYSPMQYGHKMKALRRFQGNPNCLVLLMDGSSALGLDLSFVTHVYLMEPIWDRSIEEQVVSRAHRMGATRPIVVETLAMRGTIEDQMLDFLQKISHSSAKTHHDPQEAWYLTRLALVPRHGNTVC